MKSKKLVLFFAYSRGSGLCYNFVDFILTLNDLREKDYDLKVITINKEQRSGDIKKLNEIIKDDLLIYDESSIKGKLIKISESYQEVIVHTQGLSQLIIGKNIKDRYRDKIKLVYTLHAFRNSYWYGSAFSLFVGGMLKKYVDHTIYLTPESKKEFKGSFLVRNSSIIPTGINPDEFSSPLKRSYSASFNVVYLANFTKNKGHEWLLKSIITVVKSNPNVVFHLLGAGEQYENIKKRVNMLGLDNNVILPGRIKRNEVSIYLSNMNCSIVTSNSETFGHAFLEPMLFGLPVIGTNVGVGPLVIKDYLTGFLIEKRNVNKLASKVLYLSKNPVLCEEMGRNAQKLVRSSFSWLNTATAHDRLYKESFCL